MDKGTARTCFLEACDSKTLLQLYVVLCHDLHHYIGKADFPLEVLLKRVRKALDIKPKALEVNKKYISKRNPQPTLKVSVDKGSNFNTNLGKSESCYFRCRLTINGHTKSTSELVNEEEARKGSRQRNVCVFNIPPEYEGLALKVDLLKCNYFKDHSVEQLVGSSQLLLTTFYHVKEESVTIECNVQVAVPDVFVPGPRPGSSETDTSTKSPGSESTASGETRTQSSGAGSEFPEEDQKNDLKTIRTSVLLRVKQQLGVTKPIISNSTRAIKFSTVLHLALYKNSAKGSKLIEEDTDIISQFIVHQNLSEGQATLSRIIAFSHWYCQKADIPIERRLLVFNVIEMTFSRYMNVTGVKSPQLSNQIIQATRHAITLSLNFCIWEHFPTLLRELSQGTFSAKAKLLELFSQLGSSRDFPVLCPLGSQLKRVIDEWLDKATLYPLPSFIRSLSIVAFSLKDFTGIDIDAKKKQSILKAMQNSLKVSLRENLNIKFLYFKLIEENNDLQLFIQVVTELRFLATNGGHEVYFSFPLTASLINTLLAINWIHMTGCRVVSDIDDSNHLSGIKKSVTSGFEKLLMVQGWPERTIELAFVGQMLTLCSHVMKSVVKLSLTQKLSTKNVAEVIGFLNLNVNDIENQLSYSPNANCKTYMFMRMALKKQLMIIKRFLSSYSRRELSLAPIEQKPSSVGCPDSPLESPLKAQSPGGDSSLNEEITLASPRHSTCV